MLQSPRSLLGLKLMNLYDFYDFGTPQGPPFGSLLGPWVPSGSPLGLFREVSFRDVSVNKCSLKPFAKLFLMKKRKKH